MEWAWVWADSRTTTITDTMDIIIMVGDTTLIAVYD
jgi:hypothetical protein